jgi:hypothetical protein
MAKITKEQKRAARNMLRTQRYNAGSTAGQLSRDVSNLDMADRQNRANTDVTLGANSKQSEADRFAQALKLQGSASRLNDESGIAMQGSQLGGVQQMLGQRNAMDSAETLTTLGGNQQAAYAALDDALGENRIKKRELYSNAAFQTRNLEADAFAQLNTINPRLARAWAKKGPGRGKTNFGSGRYVDRFSQIRQNTPTVQGYYTTDDTMRSGGYS